jgi:hypothetical protein
MSRLSRQVSYQYTYNWSRGRFGIQLRVAGDILRAQAQSLRGRSSNAHMYSS